MTIGEVAKASGLRTSAIRYYEQAGLLPEPTRIGGQRRYDRRVLERLAVVAFAKTCGFTLPEVRTLLSTSAGDAPLARRLRLVAKRKLAELDSEAQAIALQKKRIEHTLQCHCADLGECGRRILARRSIDNGS
jgi:MerR family redox-sensitive transcriptional activator SoxR